MSSTAQKFGTVMIIDDNTIDLYITSQVISRSNFGKTVMQFSSAAKALDYLKSNSHDTSLIPEVIFIDIYMPGMSGFEFMEAYDGLSQEVKNHCRVYIVSSSIDKEDINRIDADANVFAFHEKPISRGFLETIQK